MKNDEELRLRGVVKALKKGLQGIAERKGLSLSALCISELWRVVERDNDGTLFRDNDGNAVAENGTTAGTVRGKVPSEPPDPRHVLVRELIRKQFKDHFAVDCTWDVSEAKQLKLVLKANPTWTVEGIAGMVTNLFLSEGVTSARPRMWLANLGSYAAGPLDRFGKAKGQNEQRRLNYAEQRVADVDAALDRIRAESRGVGRDAGQGDGRTTDGGTVEGIRHQLGGPSK